MTWLLENHRHNYPRFISLSPLRLIPPKKISMNIHFFHLLKKISMNIFIYTLLPSPPAQNLSPSHHLCICTTTLYCDFFCICICKSTLVLWLILYMYLYSYVFVFERALLYILWILFDQRIAAQEVQCSTTHGKILNRIDLFIIINRFLSFSTSLN